MMKVKFKKLEQDLEQSKAIARSLREERESLRKQVRYSGKLPTHANI